MDGRRRRVPSAARGKKRKTSFTEPRNERKTTVEALHDFAGRFIHSAAAKSAPATARAMDGGPWRGMRRARGSYGGYPAAADKTSKARLTYRHVLVPLPVAAHDVVALLLEPLREVRRDEAARAGDADLQLLLGPVRLGAVNPAQFVAGGGHLKRWVELATSR